MKNLPLTLCLFLSITAAPSLAQDDARQADRDAMLVILGGIEKALNDRDISAVLEYMDENVIITFQDATVTQGPAAAKEYTTV